MSRKVEFDIDIHHLTRVEGHGDIRISVRDGRLAEATWAVVETPRFFESIVRGMSAERAPFLTSRICGICSISHTLASIRALERAMEIDVPETARLVRQLAMYGEHLQSHALHLFFLALPDFLGTTSALPLLQSHPEIVQTGLQLKAFGNDISTATCGRCTHPVSLVLGGITKAPSREQLASLRQAATACIPALSLTAELFGSLRMPEFVRETEFISLRPDAGYPSIGGDIVSTDGLVRDENDYLLMTNEYLPDFSTSKFTRVSRESAAVGALARYNNNADRLHPEARELATALGLAPGCHNPFMNNIAQLVECRQLVEDAVQLIDRLLASGPGDSRNTYRPKAGAATGAVEAPRGVLYHFMETDDNGRVLRANCIIPTTQNNANIHYDLHALAVQALAEGRSETETERLCEMLVRAYDPCISCSVH